MLEDPPQRTPMGKFHFKGARSNTRKCIPSYTTTFEIQILPIIKFSLHIPICLLRLKNWEALTRIFDSVRFYNNSLSTSKKVFGCLRILKALHLVRLRRSSIGL